MAETPERTSRIARVFPRRTRATPNDDDAYTTPPPMWAEYDAVHVSVAFTWDIPHAEWLAKQWRHVAPVTIGGPAVGMRGFDFEPGRYLRGGYTITSRGCPRRCWFCSVPAREGTVRELPIRDGWNVLDDNLLACSEEHIRAVIEMLRRQPQRAEFTGGLDAALLQDWHAELIGTLTPRPTCFFAFDPGDREEILREAARTMLSWGWTREAHRLRCYVLIGHPKDTQTAAERRLSAMLDAGFTPMAMLYRNDTGETSADWRAFQRQWARPALIHRVEAMK